MGSSPWDQGSSRKHLLDAIEASLRRLNTDFVDLYQLHMDDPATPLDETADALDAIIRSGKARYIGVSNFLAYRLARAIGLQDTLRLARFVSVQPSVPGDRAGIVAAGSRGKPSGDPVQPACPVASLAENISRTGSP
jgi:aryl-alcohol dehydrogenase-like predicted oxidoreductase